MRHDDVFFPEITCAKDEKILHLCHPPPLVVKEKKGFEHHIAMLPASLSFSASTYFFVKR